jgi:hypothetical protein
VSGVKSIDRDLLQRKLARIADTLMPAQIRDECFVFLEVLGKKFAISQAILYGSYAQKREHSWSDIDLAVISIRFRGMPFVKRTILLRQASIEANTPRVQAIGFTPYELETAEYPRIVREVRCGIPLFNV